MQLITLNDVTGCSHHYVCFMPHGRQASIINYQLSKYQDIYSITCQNMPSNDELLVPHIRGYVNDM
jgi:hypothetical protein